MYIEELKEINQAPCQGHMLVYTREKIIFQPYISLEEVQQILREKELLEIHLFDSEKEYRAVVTRSPRFHGIIENMADFKEQDRVDTYADVTMLDGEKQETLTVLNHIHFDEETGMADIDNYRLKMEE